MQAPQGMGLGELMNSIIASNSALGSAQIGADANVQTNWLDNFTRDRAANNQFVLGSWQQQLQKLLADQSDATQRYGIDQNTGLARYQSDNSLEGQKYSSDASARGNIESSRLAAAPNLLGQENKQKRFDTVWGSMSPMLGNMFGGGMESVDPQPAASAFQMQAAPATAPAAAPVQSIAPQPAPAMQSPRANLPGYTDPRQQTIAPPTQRGRVASLPATGAAPAGGVRRMDSMRATSAGGPGKLQVDYRGGQAHWKPEPRYGAGSGSGSGGGMQAAPATQAPAAPASPGVSAFGAGQGAGNSPPPLPSNLGIDAGMERRILNNAESQINQAAGGLMQRDMPNKYAASGFSTMGKGFAADQGLAEYRRANGLAQAQYQVPLQVAQFNAPLKAQLANMQQQRYGGVQDRNIQRTGQGLGFLGNLLSQ